MQYKNQVSVSSIKLSRQDNKQMYFKDHAEYEGTINRYQIFLFNFNQRATRFSSPQYEFSGKLLIVERWK